MGFALWFRVWKLVVPQTSFEKKKKTYGCELIIQKIIKTYKKQVEQYGDL